MKPDLLLKDEPSSALDAIIREEAQELFLDIWNENKINIFFITHSIDEALYMGKKIIVFIKGFVILNILWYVFSIIINSRILPKPHDIYFHLSEILTNVRLCIGTAFSILFFSEAYGTSLGVGYFIQDA